MNNERIFVYNYAFQNKKLKFLFGEFYKFVLNFLVAQIDSKQSGCKCNKVINVPYKFSLENPPNSSFHFKLVATYREHSAIHKSRRELKNTHNTWTNFSR